MLPLFDPEQSAIEYLEGRFAFLSNFHECRSTLELPGVGVWEFESNEAFYQAMKTNDPSKWHEFVGLSPGKAKRWGKTLIVRPDWKEGGVNLLVMAIGLARKFSKGSYLGGLLEATEKMQIVENTHWFDSFWGKYQGEGTNWLGLLLMRQRAFLQEGIYPTIPGCPIDLTREFKPLQLWQIPPQLGPPAMW